MQFIADLDEDEAAGLVALLWIGRGDFEAKDWEDAVCAGARAARKPDRDLSARRTAAARLSRRRARRLRPFLPRFRQWAGERRLTSVETKAAWHFGDAAAEYGVAAVWRGALPEPVAGAKCPLLRNARRDQTMKSSNFLPLALCLALGACAAPTGPSVVAIAPEGVTDANFARDAATCRARAQGVTDVEAANGALLLQDRSIRSMPTAWRTRAIMSKRTAYYGPGPYAYGPRPFYGPGPYVGGVGFYYGGGWGRRW